MSQSDRTVDGAPPIISFVGKSGVGKTTVLEKVIAEIKARGYKVGTVKHDAHGFDVDKPGKDTWRHARAGSDAVAISGPKKMALIRQLDQEMALNEVVALMGKVDLVITEGYKSGDKPKVEISRKARGTELLCQASELVAIMADHDVEMAVPQFALEDAAGIVDLLTKRFIGDGEELC